jgi:hypothetical protein
MHKPPIQSFVVVAQIKTHPHTGKKHIVSIRFTDSAIHKLTDKSFYQK